jgi:two-component system chemotaxis response regulator CheY
MGYKMAKILIIDDSETVRMEVRETLETGGHEVFEAIDGVEGLSQFKNIPGIQMAICDVNMPNMDGITMCGKVKEDESIAKIPIIMLTTESSPDLKARGKEAGVLAWMIKPFNGEKMLAAITKVLSR